MTIAQERKGEKMDDLISRQAAIDAIEEMQIPIMRSIFPEEQFVFKGMSEALSAIKDLPSVQPEIIRCRDCKHWDKTWTNDWSPDYHYCPMIDGVRKGDFYCADAERRTDE